MVSSLEFNNYIIKLCIIRLTVGTYWKFNTYLEFYVSNLEDIYLHSILPVRKQKPRGDKQISSGCQMYDFMPFSHYVKVHCIDSTVLYIHY